MKLSENELTTFKDLIEELDNYMGNAGCNDLLIDSWNYEEKLAYFKSVQAEMELSDEGVIAAASVTNYTYDFMVLKYLVDKLLS